MRLGYARSQAGATFDESVRLEPTQVSGFTQSFRTLINESLVGGLSAPLFDISGASVSYKLPSDTYLGAEAFFRTTSATKGVGVLNLNGLFVYDETSQLKEELDYEEWGGSVYVNQLIGDEWALGARYTYTTGELDRSIPELTAAAIGGFSSSESSALHQAEAYLIWNHESGWYSRLNARFSRRKTTATRPPARAILGRSWISP